MTDTTTTSSNGNGVDPATVAEALAGMDVPALFGEAIRKAMVSAVAAHAKDYAKEALEKAMTPEVVAGLQARAAQEAAEALAPPVEDEPEEEPQPRFQNVEEFVNEYVVQVYMREVCAPRSEDTYRWCPRWWEHAEVLARFEALWPAFEHLRNGATTEQSEFWLYHLDPHMAQILNPQGPFKYCSVSKGHRDELVPLPTEPSIEAMCSSAHFEMHPSGLIIPTTQPRSARRPGMNFLD
ncbi:DUF4913 domain-containing protein [Nocardia cyriacigeorgica]|uniref:DUF4913 domain-containing protein n=1 Tax=Nocardia cyriacigeorgica TaxID=135487 RepID=UPI0024544E19|nr:DUF4913 domain-containing protein [Nocardia cyriacigeorgica]